MVDLHGLAHFKFNLRPLEIFRIRNATFDVLNLVIRRWLRLVASHKTNGSGGVFHEVHRLRDDLVFVVPQVDVNEHVSGEQFLHRNFLFSPADIHHLFLGHEHLFDVRAHLFNINPFVDAVEYLLLLSGESVNDVPSVCHVSPVKLALDGLRDRVQKQSLNEHIAQKQVS